MFDTLSSEFCTLDQHWNVMNGVLSLNHPIRLEVDELAMQLTITGEQDEAKTLDTVRRL